MHEGGSGSGTDPWRARATACALALLCLLVQAPLFDRSIVPMDEGHLAAAADWMLDGKRLYSEIHTGIFPGIYLIASGLFAIFGRDLLVLRIAAVAVNLATTLALYAVARRVVRPRLAVCPPLLHLALLVLSFPVLSMFNYSTLAVCFGLFALLALLRSIESGRTLDLLLLGACVAAAAITKQNFGGLIFIALWVGLAWSRRESALADRSQFRCLLPIAASGAALTLVALTFFLAQGTLAALIDSTLLSLGGSQLRDFNNPIPPIFGAHPADARFVFLYSPPALFNALVHGESFVGLTIGAGLRSAAIRLSYGVPSGLLMGGLVLLWRSGRWPVGSRRAATRVVVVFVLIFSLGIFPSAIWSHLAFVAIPMSLLVALLAEQVEESLAARAGTVHAARIVWRTAWIAFGAVLAIMALTVTRQLVAWNPHPLDLARARLRVSDRDLGLYLGTLAFVDECAAPGEPILALPDIPIVYFLSDRPNPSPYDLTIPGDVDGDLIVRRIDEQSVRCVVLNPQMYPEFPPFKQLFPSLAVTLEQKFRGERIIEGGGTRWIGLVRREDGTITEGGR